MDIVRERIIANRLNILKHYNLLATNEQRHSVSQGICNSELLQKQVDYVASSSPFYRNLLRRMPIDRWLNDCWEEIPIAGKETLLENFDAISTNSKIRFAEVERYLQNKDLIDDPYPNPNYMVVSTAGTSGQLGYFAYSIEEQDFIRALYCRFLNAVVNTVHSNEPLRTCSLIMTGAHLFGYKMQRDLPSSTYQLIPVMQNGNPTSIEEIAARIKAFQPHVFICYGSTMRMLADYKQQTPGFTWNPQVIINTGATMEIDVKIRCEQIFSGVTIFDLYASTDLGYIAWTCEHGRMHLNTDCFHLELLDEHKKPVSFGEVGSVVVTSYWHRTLPTLRYEIGDLLSLSNISCDCGRNLPLVEKLVGRKNTLLYRKMRGRQEAISQGVIMELFENLHGVKRFRLVQKSVNDIEVHIVTAYEDETISLRVEDSLRSLFGQESIITVRRVDEILPNARSGKVVPVERIYQPGGNE